MRIVKKTLCRLFAVVLAVCLAFGAVTSVSAAVPTDSYTYWQGVTSNGKAVYGKSMYDVDKLIDVADLGLTRFTQITAMCKDDNNNVYILDSSSRIVILDNQYNLVGEIGLINGSIAYDNAKGIYYNDGVIYVCDTENAQILMINQSGALLDTITLPESNLIPEDFHFKPTKITRDKDGYMYVVSDGCYYGALLYSPERKFLGFYGANQVNATLSSVLTNIWNRMFPNAEKHANSIKKLPYALVDITVDEDGFVFTSNGFTDLSTDARKAMIRRLSPGTGDNILKPGGVFGDVKTLALDDMWKQDFCDIEVDENGFMYALDSRYGKVFVYDSDCNTVTTFGGGMKKGNQKGTFMTSCAIVVKNNGEQILVADASTGFITAFNINEYGKKVKELDFLTLDGNYDMVKEGWQEVLAQDANSQLAYSGLANAYLEEEDYDTALKYAKMGYDKDTYAVAFEYVRKDFISDNFTWIFILIVVLVVGAIAFMFITNKKKVVLIKSKSLNLMVSTAIHPSNSFTDIKEKHLGSLPLCFMLIVLYYVVTVTRAIAGGFMFTNYDPSSFNSIIELVRSVGLVVLWIVANWLVSTLLGGKGKIKEIVIVTCYSLQPLILVDIIHTILTNVLLPDEAAFLGILSAIATIYFCIMLVIGMLKIHDYSMGKFIWTTLLTVIGMAIIVFLLIMLIILIQQFGAFIATIVTEIITI